MGYADLVLYVQLYADGKRKDRRNAQGRKAFALNKRAQTEQWKGTTQGGKERRNLREGQSISHPNGGHCIHRMYVDGGSTLEILYEHCFNRLRLEIKNQLVPATNPLIGFSGEVIQSIGQIQLLLRIRDEGHSTSALMNFVVVRLVPLECALVSGPEETLPVTKPILEERVKVAINPEYQEETPADMTGVPRHIAKHRLNVREGCSPVRHKKRGQVADRNHAIHEEIRKLVEAGFMKEVHYHDWLFNQVIVKKDDDSWRMCIDFKDLNKACPKDGYPLSEID
uniref:Reverse transcriptase domain-containing protein n=1 Tax=Tanacetum cinerariifolium TaxID=118510 RepID=A0A699JT42_TANCI|nr:hypothetical protein [Tanacetum cinerariifolium]